MKFHNIIEDLLTSKVKASVLKLVASYPQKKFNGRELSRLTGSSASSVLQALLLFNDYGIVKKTMAGKTTQWVLNDKNFIANKLDAILKIDREAISILHKEIKTAFAKSKAVKTVILFGSISRREEEPRSDIDLFIEVKRDSDKAGAGEIVDILNRSFLIKYGNAISPIIYSSGELKTKRDTLLVKQIREGKAIIA